MNGINQRTQVQTTGSAFSTQPAEWNWGYDALGQVTSADSPTSGFDRAYEYDLIGNRRKTSDGALVTSGAATVYDPNNLNQHSEIRNQQSSIVNPVHDPEGNATAYPLPVAPATNATLVYDGENRLISVSTATTSVSYAYDPQSRRVARTEGTNTTLYLYDRWNCVAEYSTSDLQTFDLKTSYTWDHDLSGSLQYAGGVGALLSVTRHQTQGAEHFYPTYGGNANISEYLTASGSIAAHYEYDPFGRTIVASGTNSDDVEYRFSTKPVEPAIGLYYCGYRWYNPEAGRWINRDPIEERGGVNFYSFTGNGGANWSDIGGLEVLIFGSIHGGACLAWNDLSFVGYLADTEPFARSFVAGLQELIGQCATITIEWAGNSLGNYRGKRGKVYKLEYENEKLSPECCSKCRPAIKAVLDSDKKYEVRNFGRTDNAFWSNGPHDTMINAEGRAYINLLPSFGLPEGTRQGNASKPSSDEVQVPFSVLLWHELISHGFLGFHPPQIDANGGKIVGHAPNGYPIYEGGPGWLREGGSYIDPTNESENEARQCLRDLGSSIGNRRP